MRLAGLRNLSFWALAVFVAAFVSGCDNPFDPLNTSSKIQGLTYFDFSSTWERWDSDPEYDGVEIELAYYNEFGDSLSFHDKPHKVTIEFWTQTEDEPPARGSLLFSKTVEYSNSDDAIRIPIESYAGSIGAPSTETITGIILVRIFPPEKYPRAELFFVAAGQTFYEPEDVAEP